LEWRHSSPDRKIGLLYEEEAAMRKNAKGSDGREAGEQGQLWLRLPGLVREALYDTVIGTGLACVKEVLEAERARLCGVRYRHQTQRRGLRAGTVASSLVLGGRRVKVRRPRARSVDGHELMLPSWQAWTSRDPLDERSVEQMVLGVSSRRYARSLEPLPQDLEVSGVSKSAVSERFVIGTQRRLAELMARDLSGLSLVVLMIDGVHFADHVILAAVGIDHKGAKHVLGLREGATESAAACKALLADLIERGLAVNRCVVVVIDGAKALHRAVTDTLGECALIQRCQQHKKRNVTDALPQRMRGSVLQAMNQAYAIRDAKHARKLLDNLARRLEHAHPGAAASLREGLEETLTVMRLELPQNLERVLSSTNLIENLFSSVRDTARRVKRWQGGMMVLRWTAAGVLEAERHFRKIVGYRALPKLVAALRDRDAAFATRRGVENTKRAA
jgi:transposase-like protein